ncbi:hypothetical protein H8J79_13910 [Clostridium perfringens]|uniref:hypothetical protein n=1 Tax=Clostridium perfringens TaxID=1502 RepID=UPI0018E412B3|nr:hypothetical protein [Clostridium perfringens]MBI6021897.1 hypothetical protein [Clostridium perfringens]
MFSKKIKSDITSVKVPLKKEDGKKYEVKVSTLNNKNKILDTVTAKGKTKDFYAEPYAGSYRISNGKLVFDGPTSKDWWKMFIVIDGVEYSYIRGKDGFDNIPAPEKATDISITLKDYEGNMSVPTILKYNP